MKELLRSLITVNTYKGKDKFYFKNPALVGTVDGKNAYCVFYYSHHDEYMVFAIAWEGTGFDFHYLSEDDMLPSYTHHFRTLEKDTHEFVPATDIVDIFPNYMELIYNATQEQENIEYNKYYGDLYDKEREILYYFDKKYDEAGYNRYDDATYLSEYPMRLQLTEYNLLHARYVNLKPNTEEEAEFAVKKAYTKEEILATRDQDREMSEMSRKLMDELLNEEND